jgi:hypothetical protein
MTKLLSNKNHKLYLWALPATESIEAAADQLKGFDLGTEAYYQRRKELVGVLVSEAKASVRAELAREGVEFGARLVEGLCELFLICRHRRTLSMYSRESSVR